MFLRGTKAFLAGAAFYGYNTFVSHLPGYGFRKLYLTSVLRIKIGKGVAIHMGCFITGRNISIGDRTVINRKCHLDGRVGLAIGKDVSISPECCLLSLDHDVHSPDFATVPGPVVIGDYAWIGTRALILPGTELGEGAVVGAGAVVTRGCAPYEIVAGVPARKIGERKQGLRYSLAYFPWFNSDVLPP